MRHAAPQRGNLGSAMVALTAARLASVVAQFLAGVVAARLLDPAALGVSGVGLTLGWAIAIVANGGLNISAVYFLGRRPGEQRAVVGAVLGLTLGALAVGAVLTAAAGVVVGPLVVGRQVPLLIGAAAVIALATVGYEVVGALLLGLHRRGRTSSPTSPAAPRRSDARCSSSPWSAGRRRATCSRPGSASPYPPSSP